MRVEGACLCGTVRYTAEVDPERVFLCHCSDCQIHSGCMMSWSVPALESTFVLMRGELKLFTKVAESGRRRVLGFCPQCGTRILAKAHGVDEGPINLRVGALEQRDRLRPKLQVWTRSAQPWLDELGEIARIDTQP
jgi:hypothetical protein